MTITNNPYKYTIHGYITIDGEKYPVRKKEGPKLIEKIVYYSLPDHPTEKSYGNQQIIVFQVFKQNCVNFNKFEKLARVKISLISSNNLLQHGFPFKKDEKVSYVDSLKAFQQRKGFGEILMRLAIKESLLQGCNGNIALKSTNGSGGFYMKKLGFECTDSATQLAIKESLSKSVKEKIDGNLMYLPAHKVRKEIAKMNGKFEEHSNCTIL